MEYNPNLNCLQFHLTGANCLVDEALSSPKLDIGDSTKQPIRLIVIHKSMKLDYAVNQLGFNISDVAKAFYDDGSRVPVQSFSTLDFQNNSAKGKHSSSVIDKNEFSDRLFAQLKNIRFSESDKEDLNEIIKHINKILFRHKL